MQLCTPLVFEKRGLLLQNETESSSNKISQLTSGKVFSTLDELYKKYTTKTIDDLSDQCGNPFV